MNALTPAKIVEEGVFDVGVSGTPQAPFSRKSATAIWLGPPASGHSENANTANVFFGIDAEDLTTKGRPIEADDYKGVLIPCSDPSTLYFEAESGSLHIYYQIWDIDD